MNDDAPAGYRTGYLATIQAKHAVNEHPYSEVVKIVFASVEEAEQYLKDKYIPRFIEVKCNTRKHLFAVDSKTITYTFTDVWVSESIFQDSAPVA